MKKYIVLLIVFLMLSATSAHTAQIPRESVPSNAIEEQVLVTENLIGNILDDVQNGLGYADARAKSNRIIFDARCNKQTNGYAYGDLVNIANNAIRQYRDMYLRSQYYIENEEKVCYTIKDVIEDYKNGAADYTQACFNARVKIYQSVNLSFNPDVEYSIDYCYRDIPAVDSSMITIARKLLLEAK